MAIRLIVKEVNGIQEAECPNCGNPMTTNKFDANMQPLFYCDKCGEFTNQDPRVPVVEAQLPEDDSVDTGL